MLSHYLIAIAGLSVALGLVSRFLHGIPVSEPMLGLGAGMILGPHVVGYLEHPAGETEIVLNLSRVLLSFTVMTVALRYPFSEVRRRWRSVAVLLGAVLPLTVVAGAVLARGVLGTGWGTAVLLGAILAPTDPVLVSSLVSGEAAEEHLPARVRQDLSIESGANDGLGFVFVATGLYLVQDQSSAWWGLHAIGGTVGGVVVGLVAGFVTGRLVRWSRGRGFQTDATFLMFSLTFSLLVLSVCLAAGLDGILAVFVAGLTYNREISEADRRAHSAVEEGVDRLLLLPVFVLLGATAPWSGWRDQGWALLVFVAAVLLLRRLPWMLLLGRLLQLPVRARAWMGWFGPVGVAALFYVSLSNGEGAVDPILWSVTTLVVVGSTVVHGATALPGRQWAADWTVADVGREPSASDQRDTAGIRSARSPSETSER